MSRYFDCPACGHSTKEISVPSSWFGYFISKEAVEAAENALGIKDFLLADWLRGKKNVKLEYDDTKTPEIARCDCGHVMALNEFGNCPERDVPEAVHELAKRAWKQMTRYRKVIEMNQPYEESDVSIIERAILDGIEATTNS